MAQISKDKKDRRRAAEDIMHGLRELAKAIEDGVPLDERFTLRTVTAPEPRKRSS
jgi:hypothetical protein